MSDAAHNSRRRANHNNHPLPPLSFTCAPNVAAGP
eukprot:CAMPEP_0176217434 /NCGR_PEP_ID=MMETSP0121_2-20121125/17692_1 /TAXON_ID=160619 /ORGANISM="Kryptoperidinium foliaceum, Strain CCMP 1326" /LENGTH=34 /DNA_ID= /DNA_START= /DNA_END= /DNA_ORIENTATION=